MKLPIFVDRALTIEQESYGIVENSNIPDRFIKLQTKNYHVSIIGYENRQQCGKIIDYAARYITQFAHKGACNDYASPECNRKFSSGYSAGAGDSIATVRDAFDKAIEAINPDASATIKTGHNC